MIVSIKVKSVFWYRTPSIARLHTHLPQVFDISSITWESTTHAHNGDRHKHIFFTGKRQRAIFRSPRREEIIAIINKRRHYSTTMSQERKKGNIGRVYQSKLESESREKRSSKNSSRRGEKTTFLLREQSYVVLPKPSRVPFIAQLGSLLVVGN